MKLTDLYDQLSFGELRLLFLSGNSIDTPAAGISAEQYPQLLPSIELGLMEIYKRFFLNEGNATVPLVDGTTTYVLAPTDDDLFKIERVYGVWAEEEYEIPMNEQNNPRAIRNTSMDTLVLPTDTELAPWLLETTELRVVYRANHPKIDRTTALANPETYELHMPKQYMDPLCLYIASRVHTPLGAAPGSLHEGNNYFQRFLASVQELKNQNYEIDENVEEERFSQRGFV